MKKVILNKCFGGFDVSPQGYQLYAIKKGYSHLYKYKINFDFNRLPYKLSDKYYQRIDLFDDSVLANYFTKDFGEVVINISKSDWDNYHLYLSEEHREDPILIEVVEELGEEASGKFGELVVVEIPDDLEYTIDNYDGIETLHEDVPVW